MIKVVCRSTKSRKKPFYGNLNTKNKNGSESAICVEKCVNLLLSYN